MRVRRERNALVVRIGRWHAEATGPFGVTVVGIVFLALLWIYYVQIRTNDEGKPDPLTTVIAGEVAR